MPFCPCHLPFTILCHRQSAMPGLCPSLSGLFLMLFPLKTSTTLKMEHQCRRTPTESSRPRQPCHPKKITLLLQHLPTWDSIPPTFSFSSFFTEAGFSVLSLYQSDLETSAGRENGLWHWRHLWSWQHHLPGTRHAGMVGEGDNAGGRRGQHCLLLSPNMPPPPMHSQHSSPFHR